MNRQQRRKMAQTTAKSTTNKTNLQLLSELGGAPTIARVKKIGYFYKNDVPEGFGGYFEDIDEDYAGYIVQSLNAIYSELQSHGTDKRKEIVQHYKSQLECGRELMTTDSNIWFVLFCNIWLLDKIGAINSDEYNGVIFLSERT